MSDEVKVEFLGGPRDGETISGPPQILSKGKIRVPLLPVPVVTEYVDVVDVTSLSVREIPLVVEKTRTIALWREQS